MKYFFIVICISVLCISGCGKDVERKIEVTIKDKASNPTTGKTSSPVKNNELHSLNFKKHKISDIVNSLKSISKTNIFYPEWFDDEKISIQVHDMTVRDILAVIAEKTGTVLEEMDTGYMLVEDEEFIEDIPEDELDELDRRDQFPDDDPRAHRSQRREFSSKKESMSADEKREKLREFAKKDPASVMRIYKMLIAVKEKTEGRMPKKGELIRNFEHEFYKHLENDPETIDTFIEKEVDTLNLDKKLVQDMFRKALFQGVTRSIKERFQKKSFFQNNNTRRQPPQNNGGFFND